MTSSFDLVMIESMRLISGRQDPDVRLPRRVYFVTANGRQRAGIDDARPAA